MASFGAGNPIPVTTVTGGAQVADAAQPVYVVSGTAPVSGRARRVVVVTSGTVKGGPAIPVYDVGSGALTTDDPPITVYVVSGTLGVVVATFANGEIGNVSNTIVVVNWTAGIVSPGNDYTLGVTIKVNGSAATINSASRPSTTQTRYTLSAAVAAGDTVTWEYNSGPGDLQSISDGTNVATINAQSITNNLLTTGLLAEAGDFLITEASDFIVQE